MSVQLRKGRWVGLWCLIVAGWWTLTSWVGHQAAPWAIQLTNPAFAGGLLVTYAACWALAASVARNWRRVVFRAIAATLSLGVGVLILEVPAVAGLIDYAKIRAAITGEWDGPSEDFIEDHELSFKRPPHARWSGRPRSNMAQSFNLPIRARNVQTFSTDSHGFRNATELTHADIALLGDSYIEGAYVSDEETVSARLGAITGRPVANLALSGYGTLQESLVLEKFALPLGPRLVAWFFFEGNDLDDDQSFENAMVYERLRQAATAAPPPTLKWREFLNRTFVQSAFLELRRVSDPLVPNGVDTFGEFRDRQGVLHRMYFFDFYATRRFGDFERDRFEITKATFRRASEICRQHGIRLVVFYVPIKFRVYGNFCSYPAGSPCVTWKPWDLEARFAAFCREAGIEFVSLAALMRPAAAAGEVLYAPEDSHWSAEGHLFVAKQIQALMAETRPH